MKKSLKLKTKTVADLAQQISNKKIVFAGQDKISKYEDFAQGFMKKIFQMKSFLISDESLLSDFIDVFSRSSAEKFNKEEKKIFQKILKHYNVDVSQIKPLYLWKIFEKICSPKTVKQQIRYASVNDMIHDLADGNFKEYHKAHSSEVSHSLFVMRNERKISLKKMAILMKCSVDKIERIESSEDKELKIKDLIEYANALGLKLNFEFAKK